MRWMPAVAGRYTFAIPPGFQRDVPRRTPARYSGNVDMAGAVTGSHAAMGIVVYIANGRKVLSKSIREEEIRLMEKVQMLNGN